MAKEYFAFISYKSEDVEWAVWLQHELEHYHLPASFNGRDDIRQDLRPVFRDIDELSAGNLPQQIYEALVNSQNLIIVCSPLSASSPWVNQEVETFISLGRTDCIFPFIVDGKTPKEFFPPALLNLPQNQERLGGEVRKNGRDAAFVKIVAGILHVNFDSLWNRYEREKAEQERIERERRDTLLRVQSRFIAEKAIDLVEKGDSYLAQRILLEAMPKELENPDRPYTPEVECAFREALKNPSAILFGHDERVNCAVYSPDGKTIISGGKDNRIRIWDARNGAEIQNIHEHSDSIEDISFSPNKKMFAAISSDTLTIWDAEITRMLVRKTDVYPRIQAIAFCPNDAKIAVAQQETIVIWDIEAGIAQDYFTGHTNLIHSIAYSPDGEYLVSSDMRGGIYIWDTVLGKLVRRIEGPNNEFHKVSFSPNGKYILTACSDNNIYIWDAETGAKLKKLEGHTHCVTSAVYSLDGKRIVSSSWDHTVRIWDAEIGEELVTFKGHTEGVNSAVFSPDGNYIISTSDDKTVRIWYVGHRDEYRALSKEKFIGTGKTVIFSHDGKRIISISYSDDCANIIQIWDAETRQEMKRLIGHEGTINSIALSRDGQYVASASSDMTIRIWSIETGKTIKQIKGHEDSVYAVAYSPDGKYLVSASSDETIRIWDASTGIEIKRIESDEEYIPSITFSPDGKCIAAALFMWIQVWDVASGEKRNKIDEDSIVKHITYSHDGQYLVAASNNETIRLWNASTGILLREMKGHAKGINYIDFSLDDKYLVSASEDSTVRIWDVETGVEILTLDRHSGRVFCASFSPNGEHVVTAPDEEIRVWDFPSLQDLIDKALEQFKDCPLTPEERKKYYLD